MMFPRGTHAVGSSPTLLGVMSSLLNQPKVSGHSRLVSSSIYWRAHLRGIHTPRKISYAEVQKTVLESSQRGSGSAASLVAKGLRSVSSTSVPETGFFSSSNTARRNAVAYMSSNARHPAEPIVPRPSPPPSMHARAGMDSFFDYKDSTSHHFDTYHLVHQLEKKGFAKESAEAVMYALSGIVNENIGNITASSVTKAQFEKAMYVNKVDFAHASNEMQLLERNDFSNVKSDVAKLNSELERYQNKRSEALRRIQSQVRLELTLEKARARDELSKQELKIKETESKIDTEFSNLRSTMETIYWDLFKSIFPLFCAAGALFFSYMRIAW